MIGIILVSSTYIYVLFNPCTTHSFISAIYVTKHNLPCEPLNVELYDSTLIKSTLIATHICKSCIIKIGDIDLLTDLTILHMQDFDIILGIDWLVPYHAMVDCYKKKVKFWVLGQSEISFIWSLGIAPPQVFSTLQTMWILNKGCKTSLATVKDSQQDKPILENIPTISKFADIFSKDLIGSPLNKEIEFSIEVVPSITPISKPRIELL